MKKILESAGESLAMVSQVLGSSKSTEPVQIRSVLGVKAYNSWVYEFNISDVMAINWVTLEEYSERPPLHAEFTKDFLLYKVALHATALFCVATEIKHLRSFKRLSSSFRKNA